MIQTGEETDDALADLADLLSTAEVQIESYLKQPNQPRHSNATVYAEISVVCKFCRFRS